MSGAEQTLRGSLPSLCSCPSETVLVGMDKDHQAPGHSFPVLADEGLCRAMVIYRECWEFLGSQAHLY